MALATYYKPELDKTLVTNQEIGIFAKLAERFCEWRIRNKTRQQLRRLPDHVLEDIGINRYQIEHDLIRF